MVEPLKTVYGFESQEEFRDCLDYVCRQDIEISGGGQRSHYFREDELGVTGVSFKRKSGSFPIELEVKVGSRLEEVINGYILDQNSKPSV